MPQHKGCRKAGGRKKGAKNKAPQMAPLRIQLRDLGFNLGAEMVKVYNSVDDVPTKLKLFEMITKYTNVIPTVETYVDPVDLEDESDDDIDALLSAVQ